MKLEYYLHLQKRPKAKGFTSGHFSFNVKEGSCPYCKGLGEVKIDMDFMEDAKEVCKQCNGNRVFKRNFSNKI